MSQPEPRISSVFDPTAVSLSPISAQITPHTLHPPIDTDLHSGLSEVWSTRQAQPRMPREQSQSKQVVDDSKISSPEYNLEMSQLRLKNSELRLIIQELEVKQIKLDNKITELQEKVDAVLSMMEGSILPKASSGTTIETPGFKLANAEVNAEEVKFRSLYEAYIREHEKDLISRSIIVYTDESRPPEVYKSIAEAYSYLEGRSNLYQFTYYGPEARFITINYLGVTTGFGGNNVYGLSNGSLPGNLRYNSNYAYLSVRIRWTPEPDGIVSVLSIMGTQRDTDGTRYIDVKMMIDTGAVVSLGPESVLTQLGLRPSQPEPIYGVMGTRHYGRSVRVKLELLNTDPNERTLSIPILLNYIVEGRNYGAGDVNLDLRFSDRWILGRDFQQYFQMLWTGVITEGQTVDFIGLTHHQDPDGKFVDVPRTIYPDREYVIESPVHPNDDNTFRVVVPAAQLPEQVAVAAPAGGAAPGASCCVIL